MHDIILHWHFLWAPVTFVIVIYIGIVIVIFTYTGVYINWYDRGLVLASRAMRGFGKVIYSNIQHAPKCHC